MNKQLTDWFGNVIATPSKSALSAKGYAARPGSGPEGETCEGCEHASRSSGGNKAFWKCSIIRHRWTHGPGTDIRLKSPACSFWEKWKQPVAPEGLRWLKVGEKFQAGDVWVETGGITHPVPEQFVTNKTRCDSGCQFKAARKQY